MIAAAIIIVVGYFAFDFTLLNGALTFLNMMILCFLGLVIFLGMGFIISSIAKNESLIPPLANMITMPQLILSGVFLSTSNFPDWMQPICNALPLTQLNNGLREIAFQGKSLFEIWQPLLILGIWGILVYAIAVKVFRWE
jgi:ABC-2 type transport system permease protein